MLIFDYAKMRIALFVICSFHILVIAASNYLVQLPITLLGFHTTWGAFSFPFLFLATDLTVRLMGRDAARRLIARVMLPALVVSYLVSVLFQQGQWRGMEALGSFNLFIARIALASFMAYVLGQTLDIVVFDRLRQRRPWWLAPVGSTIVGNLLDTFIFFFVAFWQSPDPFMAEHWIEIALVDYGVKLIISLLLFLPLYAMLLVWLQRCLLQLSGAKARAIDDKHP
ncbi:7-cyano-7-deazaguanine/7-aminomethyl-7-deazaguanine transporter [Kushneria sp. EE4]